jgi:N utilization substance protein B
MSVRSQARQVVLQLLYQDDLNPEIPAESVAQFLRKELKRNASLTVFALSLLDGVREHRAELDAVLDAKAKHWSVKRMAIVDRNILRLGTYEILYAGTPGQVVINEAVELAKRFGDRQSPSFVNGILDRVMRDQDHPQPHALEDGIIPTPPNDT